MKISDESLHASAEDLVERLARKMDGLELAATDRNRLAAGCFRQAMEHHRALVHLVRANLGGSALALLRPLFEHYVRGLWLAKCASAADLVVFQNATLERTIAAMLTAVEFLDADGAGVHEGLRRSLSRAMHDFLRGQKSAPSPGDETRAAIALAGTIGLLAASEVALMAGRLDIVSALIDEAVSTKGAVRE